MDFKPTEADANGSKVDVFKQGNLGAKFKSVRRITESLCEPLEIEDFVVQPVVDVSPPKWHLAHTTWFFEELILKKYLSGYNEFNSQFGFMFNSYYETIGERVLRPNRGNMTRPTVREVMKYREHVNGFMQELLNSNGLSNQLVELVTLGLNHEQQHQELLITDLKYILGHNPVFPAYQVTENQITPEPDLSINWLKIDDGVFDIGFAGQGFHFDNEEGRHKAYIHSFQLMDRLVTNGEYLEFMEDGGYKDFRWWLSEAWDLIQNEDIKAPMYWHKIEGKWMQYKLSGLEEVNPNEPVTHISLFEADAFAQWKGLRLPTEFEWEVTATKYANSKESGTFLDDHCFHPSIRNDSSSQFFGDVWEWTNSAYLPYPYFTKEPGAVGEYNGKFMVNQKVLRGGSCATPRDHIRLTYRNFFHPHLRWQFNGFRLAQTI
jgi:ergothioneine biosynthesis protein EgtB